MKTAFGTVIYQEALEFGHEFMESLNHQEADFDIVILNDNCTLEQMNDFTEKSTHKVIVKESGKKMLPGRLRIELILYAIALQYDLLVMGDFDDTFFENRVKTFQANYDLDHGFFYNELFDFQGRNLMKNIPAKTGSITDIVNYNYIGLSNSALNLKKMPQNLLQDMKNDETSIFDWYFFSRLLLAGVKGKFVENTGTFYRIHQGNIAGITYKNITLDMIKREIQIKINHYELLGKHGDLFEEKLLFYQQLQKKVMQEGFDLNAVCENEFWWGLLRDR